MNYDEQLTKVKKGIEYNEDKRYRKVISRCNFFEDKKINYKKLVENAFELFIGENTE